MGLAECLSRRRAGERPGRRCDGHARPGHRCPQRYAGFGSRSRRSPPRPERRCPAEPRHLRPARHHGSHAWPTERAIRNLRVTDPAVLLGAATIDRVAQQLITQAQPGPDRRGPSAIGVPSAEPPNTSRTLSPPTPHRTAAPTGYDQHRRDQGQLSAPATTQHASGERPEVSSQARRMRHSDVHLRQETPDTWCHTGPVRCGADRHLSPAAAN